MDISQEITDTPYTRKAFSGLRQETLVVTAVLAILAVALGLRLYGLNWDEGFAWTPHPDERAILARVDSISPPPIGDLGVLLDADEATLPTSSTARPASCLSPIGNDQL